MVAAAIVGAAVVGGVASNMAAGKGASAQENAANTASNTQMSMFNKIQGNEAPWVGVGGEANSALAQFYGLGGMSGSSGLTGNSASGPGAQVGSGSPDYNKILSSLPGYQFQLQQGTLATDHNLAARGLLSSGAAQKSLDTFGQGLAQNYAGQYTQGLQNLSQMGQAGAAGVATAGMNAANNVAGNQIYAGNAAASGYANQSNAVNQGLSGLVGAYGNYNSYQNAQYGPAYQGPTTGYAAAGGSSGGYNDFLNTVYAPTGSP